MLEVCLLVGDDAALLDRVGESSLETLLKELRTNVDDADIVAAILAAVAALCGSGDNIMIALDGGLPELLVQVPARADGVRVARPHPCVVTNSAGILWLSSLQVLSLHSGSISAVKKATAVVCAVAALFDANEPVEEDEEETTMALVSKGVGGECSSRCSTLRSKKKHFFGVLPLPLHTQRRL